MVHSEIFTGTKYKTELLEGTQSLEGTQPFYAKPYPIPKVHKEILKSEVNRLLDIGILKRGK